VVLRMTEETTVSQPPPEGFQLSADDPMMDQIEAATSGNRRASAESGERDNPDERAGRDADEERQDEPVGAEAGMGEANSFEPEEIIDDEE
jgi:hypothetical protein